MQETFARICDRLSALNCDKTDFDETVKIANILAAKQTQAVRHIPRHISSFVRRCYETGLYDETLFALADELARQAEQFSRHRENDAEKKTRAC